MQHFESGHTAPAFARHTGAAPSAASASYATAEAERERLADLIQLDLVGSLAEDRFDRIARFAAQLFGLPIAMVSLMERDRQWFKATHGLDLVEAPRSDSFCARTIEHDSVQLIDDLTQDEEFQSNPFVCAAPNIRSYAGIPVHGPGGHPVGTVCVMGYEQRRFGQRERALLEEVAAWVEHEFRIGKAMESHDRQVNQLIDRDPALPVATRTIAHERVDEALAEYAARGGQIALLHLQIDGLSEFEQAYSSHEVHSTVSRWIEALSEGQRDLLNIFRISDTEFVGLARARFSIETMRGHCQAQIEHAHAVMRGEGFKAVFEARAGLALYGEHGDSAPDLIAKARLAHQGRQDTAVGVFGDDVAQRYAIERHIRDHFEQAADSGVLHYHWQPIFDNRDKQLYGFEMLARWHELEPPRDISPGQFVPIAESEARLRRKLVESALDTGCRQLAAWQARGIDAPPYVSINIPGPEFFESDFCAVVQAILSAHRIDGSALVFELTERSLIADFEATSHAMHRLSKLGIRFALDDFGAGYSSISYLTRLPVSIVKLDMSVVQRLDQDEDARKLMRGIVDLAQGQALSIVAEGVETQIQLDWVCQLGCEYTQGFLLGRPEPQATADQRLSATSA